jgi:hypothetical protein
VRPELRRGNIDEFGIAALTGQLPAPRVPYGTRPAVVGIAVVRLPASTYQYLNVDRGEDDATLAGGSARAGVQLTP